MKTQPSTFCWGWGVATMCIVAGWALFTLIGCAGSDVAMATAQEEELDEVVGEAPAAPAAPRGAMASPVLDQTIPTQTCAERVAITGVTLPGFKVDVIGGAVHRVTGASNAETGRFCVPLLLAEGDNYVQVRARQEETGVCSAAAGVTISRNSCPQGPADAPGEAGGVVNVARDAVVDASEDPDDGYLEMLTDGDLSQSVKFTGGGGSWWQPWDYGDDFDGWVWVKLDRPYVLDAITVHWGDLQGTGGDYAKEYRLLISRAASPTAPDLDNAEWVQVEQIKDGDGGVDAFPLGDSAIVAHHVAIWMEANGESGNKESFKLNELEVTSAAADAGGDADRPSTPDESVCAGSDG